MPSVEHIEEVREPYVKATIMVPNEFVGAVMELSQKKRGQFIDMIYLDNIRVNVIYELPLSEIVYDFFDQLKSDRKSTRLNSSHVAISYAVFCLKKKTN